MNFLLKIKHWQLFFLSIFISLLATIIVGILLFSVAEETFWSGISTFFYLLAFIPLSLINLCNVFLCWMLAISIQFQKKLPPELQMKTIWLKIVMIPTIICGIFFLFFPLSFFMSDLFETSFFKTFGDFFGILYIALIVFYASYLPVLFALYGVFFTAKTYRTVQLQRETVIKEYIGDFFLILFFPIGIWILQPKINKIMAQEEQLLEESPLLD